MALLATDPAVGNVYLVQDPESEIQVQLIDYGATVTRLLVPDSKGSLDDVLLGCHALSDYVKPHPFFNCLVGRYANRIKNARFEMNGKTYQLEANLGDHHIHGGFKGFAYRKWQSQEVPNGVEFNLVSPDGEGGYPGELVVKAVYTLYNGMLKLEISATTTKITPISMTAHHYFNLSGIQGETVGNHILQINADEYTAAAEDLTQLGTIESVEGTPFDFRTPKKINESLSDLNHPQTQLAGGIDHNFVLRGGTMKTAATIEDPESGRKLAVRTNQSCMQVYTANTLNYGGKQGVRYSLHQGICFETQQYPDSLNHDRFPDSVLEPSDRFKFVTEYIFSEAD